MWQPEPGWHRVPGGPGTSTVGVWRTVLGGRPVAVKRLGAPGRRRPGRAQRPGHFAYWRRERGRRDLRRRARHPGAPVRRRRRRSTEDDEGITLVQPWVEDAAQQRAVRRARAGPLRRRRARRGSAGWPATSCATGWRASSGAAAGPRWPGPRSRTSPTTSGTGASRCWTSSTRCRRSPSTATRCRRTCPAATGTTWSRSTGARSATARSAPTSATSAHRARGVRAAARRLPARAARRAWPPASRSPTAPG